MHWLVLDDAHCRINFGLMTFSIDEGLFGKVSGPDTSRRSTRFARYLERPRSTTVHTSPPSSTTSQSSFLPFFPTDLSRPVALAAAAALKTVSFSCISPTTVSERCGRAQFSCLQQPFSKSGQHRGRASCRRTADGRVFMSILPSASVEGAASVFPLPLPLPLPLPPEFV